MTVAAITALAQALIGAIPKIIELVRKGRSPGSIKLHEVISTDALDQLEQARAKAQDYVDGG